MKWYQGEFARWTMGWEWVAKCILRDLLTICFYSEKLPRSPKLLAEACGVPLEVFRKHWKAPMRSHFVAYKGGLQNPTMQQRRDEALDLTGKRKIGGDKTAELMRARKAERDGGPQPAGDSALRLVEGLKSKRP